MAQCARIPGASGKVCHLCHLRQQGLRFGQRLEHLSGTRKSLVGDLLQCSLHDLLEHRMRPDIGVGLCQARRGLGHVLHHHLERLSGHEWDHPGEQLEQDHPKGVQIAPAVDLEVLDLLRRHEQRRAQRGADEGELHVHRNLLHDPKVEDLHEVPAHLVRAGEQVGGLEVAVDQASLVGLHQRRAYLLENVDSPAGLERSILLDQLLDCAAMQVLHGDIIGVLLVAAIVEDSDDIRVAQPGAEGGLEEEALLEFPHRVGEVQEQLDRDHPVQRALDGLVDPTHSASGDELGQLEATVEDHPKHGVGWAHSVGCRVMSMCWVAACMPDEAPPPARKAESTRVPSPWATLSRSGASNWT
jgi:hypothetical protein